MRLSRKLVLASVAVTPWILVAAFGQDGVGILRLPSNPYHYADADQHYPPYFTSPNVPGSVALADNTPADNRITNDGATLGRVLFYDRRLSRNYTMYCGECHKQSHGFSDPDRFSHGLYGGLTTRHAMGITNSRYYQNGRFFWDERAPSLEDQVLQPIQNTVEMDMTLPEVVTRLQATTFYPKLFKSAFGTPDITADRISKALAQFVRSMVSYRSKFDSAFDSNGLAHFQQTLTAQEFLGLRLFQPVPGFPNISRGCAACHTATSQIGTHAQNNGLDLNTPDGGRFKTPSLRNIATRAPYMHDGRFATLMDVVNFYDHGVQNNPFLDPLLRDPNTGLPRRLNMTQQEKDALVAFLNTLTDPTFLTDVRFSDPFVFPVRTKPHP